MRNAHEVWSENRKEKDHLGDMGIDGKWILRQWGKMMWTEFMWLRTRMAARRDNDPYVV
jgi:hypothetical protein